MLRVSVVRDIGRAVRSDGVGGQELGSLRRREVTRRDGRGMYSLLEKVTGGGAIAVVVRDRPRGRICGGRRRPDIHINARRGRSGGVLKVMWR